MNIELNIFTNSIPTAPDISIVEQTYQSFLETFRELSVTVYCDSHPNESHFKKYFKNLKSIFPEVIQTESLSHGYIESIHNSDSDYLFQLEGDWIFKNRYIRHSLDEILKAMHDQSLYHLRFNKRRNTVAAWDRFLNEKECNGLSYCETPNMSNNPHIIDRLQYMAIMENIEIIPGSKGIEEKLNETRKFIGAIYGPLNYPATVYHVDGRGTNHGI